MVARTTGEEPKIVVTQSGKAAKEAGRLSYTHSQSYGQPYDGSIPEIHFLLHDQLDPGHGNGGKYRDSCPSQDTLGEWWSAKAENFGTSPAMIRTMAASPSTQRLITLVVVTIPYVLTVGSGRKTAE